MHKEKKKILVLGASGMLGNAIFRFFIENNRYETFGTTRSSHTAGFFHEEIRKNIIGGIDVENTDSLIKILETKKPDLVINCIGLVKQLAESEDPLSAIPINALLPHRLARLTSVSGARLIHFSTDCVFSGLTGNYKESDAADAKDVYGKSKYLGEVDYKNAITLRTSIIGHELEGSRSLVGWFLAQKGTVKGFRRAIFSGLPTVEVARVIQEYVIPHPELRGLYHLSAEPIKKMDLLTLIAREYKKSVKIEADDRLVIDRSLDSTKFRMATGFVPKPWVELVRQMREFG